MSTRRLRNLGDAFRAGVSLEITCANTACGRSRLVGPARLLGIFGATASFAAIGARMVCRGADLEGGGCGHRGAIVRYSFTDPPEPDQPPPGGGNVVPFTPRRAAIDPTPAARPAKRAARGRRRARKRSHFH